MSRSKKAPYVTYQSRSRKGSGTPSAASQRKREANKAVRAEQKKQLKDEQAGVSNGKQYRKAYDSWSINDWSIRDDSPKGRRK